MPRTCQWCSRGSAFGSILSVAIRSVDPEIHRSAHRGTPIGWISGDAGRGLFCGRSPVSLLLATALASTCMQPSWHQQMLRQPTSFFLASRWNNQVVMGGTVSGMKRPKARVYYRHHNSKHRCGLRRWLAFRPKPNNAIPLPLVNIHPVRKSPVNFRHFVMRVHLPHLFRS